MFNILLPAGYRAVTGSFEFCSECVVFVSGLVSSSGAVPPAEVRIVF